MKDRDQYDINPYEYAEPLDVHRWSDHPEIDVLLDRPQFRTSSLSQQRLAEPPSLVLIF